MSRHHTAGPFGKPPQMSTCAVRRKKDKASDSEDPARRWLRDSSAAVVSRVAIRYRIPGIPLGGGGGGKSCHSHIPSMGRLCISLRE